MNEDKLSIIIVVGFLAFAFILINVVFPKVADEECLKRNEHESLKICCEKCIDVDGDGYMTYEENGLGYGDFWHIYNTNKSIEMGFHCSGYHPDRAYMSCIK